MTIEKCGIESRIERIDSESRTIAIELGKLTIAIEKLDERIDRADQSLDEIAQFGKRMADMMVQLVKVETLLNSNQETNNRQTRKLEELDQRLDELENSSKTIKTAIRWIVACVGIILTQFGSDLIKGIINLTTGTIAGK